MSRLWGAGGFLVLCLCASVGLAAQTPSAKGKESQRPTTVTADRLEVSLKDRRAIYSGNVVAETSDLRVTADQMEFDFDEKMEVVERMRAVGNVHISHTEGNNATAERATYDVVEDKVVLEGHPKAWGQGNTVSGTRIILFLKEDRQVVEGNESERVTAIITPKGQPGGQVR